MLKLNDGTYIHATGKEILLTLKRDMHLRGIDLFERFVENGDNIQTNCPFHKDGREKKPSFGINTEINKCHCFTCNWAGSIDDMISAVFGGVEDDGRLGRRWLKQAFETTSLEMRGNILSGIKLKRDSKNNKKEVLDESVLEQYSY